MGDKREGIGELLWERREEGSGASAGIWIGESGSCKLLTEAGVGRKRGDYDAAGVTEIPGERGRGIREKRRFTGVFQRGRR